MKKFVEKIQIDEIAVPLLQNLFQAITVLLCRMVKDHLPDGKYWNPSPKRQFKLQFYVCVSFNTGVRIRKG